MISQIEKNCSIYYKNKVAIKEAYDFTRANLIHFEYTLIENPREILSNYDEIYNFFFIFRNSNKLTLELIRNCEKADYEQLSHFLVHSFYENILSASFAQEDMLVLIYLLLEEWIDKNFKSSQDVSSFLKESILIEIFKSMTRKEDVRLYLKAILEKIILDIENFNEELLRLKDASSSKEKVQEINSDLRQSMPLFRKNNTREKFSYYQRIQSSNDDMQISPFAKFYVKKTETKQPLSAINDVDENEKKEKLEKIKLFFVSTNVTSVYIKDKLNEYERKNDNSKEIIEIRNFLEKQISLINSSKKEEIFSNIYFFEKTSTDEVKEKQMQRGEKIQNVLNEIMKNLEDNLKGIPYSIKCICKIIDYLIEEKFKYIKPKPSSFDQIMYIVKFFLETLIIPSIKEPEYVGIVTTRILSPTTRFDLSSLARMFAQISKGSLFTKDKDYECLIFNRFILDIMPRIIQLINWVRKTKLPSVIEKLISKKGTPNRDIEYDYFRENQNENIQHQSVCFSRKDAHIIAKILKKNTKIYQSESNENKNIIIRVTELMIQDSEKEKWKNSRNHSEEKIQFFYLSKINYRPEFENKLNGIIVKNPITNSKISFDIVQKINMQTLKEKNKQKKDETKIQKKEDKDLENIKQSINEILSNINIITKDNMDLNHINNSQDTDSFDKYLIPKIIEILKCQTYNSLSQITNQESHDKKMKLPIGFYATLLEMNLQKIPSAYSKDNYSLLLTKLTKDAEQRVKEAKNHVINQLYLKIKNSEKLNMIINMNLSQMKQLEKYINIEIFVRNVKIPAKLTLKLKNDLISKVSIEEKKITIVDTEKYSIDNFIEEFPNFSNLNVDDVIKYEESIELDKELKTYFQIIKKSVKSYDRFTKYSKEEINSIYEELENYIMSKLYDKIFPKKRTKRDIKIYNKCKRLAWISPKNLIKERKVVNENLWKNAMEFIKLMENEKTPANKIKTFGKAFSIIQNSITFCTGKDELGVDDSIQILIYVILKSKPKSISSNFNYSSLFIDPDMSKKQFGLLLTQMEMIMTIIDNMKETDLIDVTKEQFGEDLKDEEIDINDESLLE